MAGRRQNAGKRAMRREAKYKQSKGLPHHTRLHNIVPEKRGQGDDLISESMAEAKPKKSKPKSKGKPKANVVNPH